MNRQIVIDWRSVLPLDGSGWRDSIDYVIGDLQGEHGKVLRPALSSEELVDVLFVAYMARDHMRIVEDELLSRRLSTLAPTVGTFVLVACDVDLEGAGFDVLGVRELLISQGAEFGSEQRVFHSETVDLLQDHARECIGSHIRRARLIDYLNEDPQGSLEESSTELGTSVFRGEYL